MDPLLLLLRGATAGSDRAPPPSPSPSGGLRWGRITGSPSATTTTPAHQAQAEAEGEGEGEEVKEPAMQQVRGKSGVEEGEEGWQAEEKDAIDCGEKPQKNDSNEGKAAADQETMKLAQLRALGRALEAYRSVRSAFLPALPRLAQRAAELHSYLRLVADRSLLESLDLIEGGSKEDVAPLSDASGYAGSDDVKFTSEEVAFSLQTLLGQENMRRRSLTTQGLHRTLTQLAAQMEVPPASLSGCRKDIAVAMIQQHYKAPLSEQDTDDLLRVWQKLTQPSSAGKDGHTAEAHARKSKDASTPRAKLSPARAQEPLHLDCNASSKKRKTKMAVVSDAECDATQPTAKRRTSRKGKGKGKGKRKRTSKWALRWQEIDEADSREPSL